MNRSSRRLFPLALLAVVVVACAGREPALLNHSERPSARYLFAWTGDEDREDSDFLAVIDLARDGDRYGTIVATTPIGENGLWPHHTEHELGASKMLFANWIRGQSHRSVRSSRRAPSKGDGTV